MARFAGTDLAQAAQQEQKYGDVAFAPVAAAAGLINAAFRVKMADNLLTTGVADGTLDAKRDPIFNPAAPGGYEYIDRDSPDAAAKNRNLEQYGTEDPSLMQRVGQGAYGALHPFGL